MEGIPCLARQIGGKMGTDPLGALTVFVTQMIGLSVASERVTETIKQWVGTSLAAKMGPDRYSGAIQTLAILSGVFVTALSGLNPLSMPDFKAFDWWNKADWMGWIISGFLVSGGSAFWNHVLDILKATKVQKEQLANSTALAAGSPQIAP
jgi:drug/metabolite transporter (DMT)-like permease